MHPLLCPLAMLEVVEVVVAVVAEDVEPGIVWRRQLLYSIGVDEVPVSI